MRYYQKWPDGLYFLYFTMPDKPLWLGKLPAAITTFEALDFPWIDSAMLRDQLEISARRAQQIIRPMVRHLLGRNGLAHRDDVIAHLRRLATGDAARYEARRVARLNAILSKARATPRVLVEAPVRLGRIDVAGLPPGVTLAPGSIHLRFAAPEEALEKLLALAMAIGNDMEGFRAHVEVTS